ncbi:MAG: hypothetical protein J6W09_06565 [Bacteroidales bacterium]|nr:hypothetical protein [Bacteroidales bacterium]
MSRKRKVAPVAKKAKKVAAEYVGKAMLTRDGMVYVRIEGEEEDVFVKPPKSMHALHGDTVRVAVTREKGRSAERREGKIIAILERNPNPLVGVLHIVGNNAWVLMSSKTMPYDIQVPIPEGGQRGMKVAAVVDGWERNEPIPHGHVVDVLGMPGENETEMHAILAQFGLPYRFTPEVLKAADAIPDSISDQDRAGRRDFRNVLTFTIDPYDA